MRWIAAFVVLAALPLAGCATASWEMAYREPDEPKQVFGDFERLQYAKRIQVDLPARLAVADEELARYRDDEVTQRRVVAMVERLSKDGETWRDVSSLSWDQARNAEDEIEAWRTAASRHRPTSCS